MPLVNPAVAHPFGPRVGQMAHADADPTPSPPARDQTSRELGAQEGPPTVSQGQRVGVAGRGVVSRR